MTLETIAALGQIAAAGALVLALIYMARQVRQNTRSVRDSSTQTIAASFHHLNSLVAGDASLARIFSKASESLSKLEPEERVRFDFFLLSAFRVYETMYYQSRSGGAPRKRWEAEQEVIRTLLGRPGLRQWWRENPLSFAPEFRSFVEDMIQTGDQEGSWAL